MYCDTVTGGMCLVDDVECTEIDTVTDGTWFDVECTEIDTVTGGTWFDVECLRLTQ